MLTFSDLLKLAPLIVLVVAAVEYLRRINRGLEDMLEMQWHIVDMFARILGQDQVGNEFLARTGRLIRRRRV